MKKLNNKEPKSNWQRITGLDNKRNSSFKRILFAKWSVVYIFFFTTFMMQVYISL